MSTDRETTRVVRSWLEQGVTRLPDRVLDAVLDQVPTTPQRRRFWSAWRDFRVHKLLLTAAVSVSVLVVAVVGYGLIDGLGIVGPGATPIPSPTVLARGTLLAGDTTIEIEAFTDGTNVTGRLTQTDAQAATSFTVDLQCAHTTRDGWILIGGVIEATTTNVAPQGTWSAIVLRAGSPVSGRIWVQAGGPTDESTDCLAYLDGRFEERQSGTFLVGGNPGPMDGTLELRSPGTPAALLASGTFVIRDWDLVTFEANRTAAGVAGTLTARREPAAADYLRIDFACLEETEDGLLVIGGFTAPIGGEPGNTFGAIALKRGSPVLGQLWDYGPLPGMAATDCRANASEWSRQIRIADLSQLRDDIDGTFAFGP